MDKQNIMEVPTPQSYFPKFTNEFIEKSFDEEPAPGLYLPGFSGLPFQEACQKYMKGKGHQAPTIVDLNEFILASFPPPQLHFDPDKHTIVRPFSPASGNLFYQQIGLPLEPPMKDKNIKHKFYNWDLARMRLNINSDLLTPLVKYITNPLLTTIPFHSDLNPHFIGLCLESTDPEGWLVSRTKSFPTSSAGLRSASMNLDKR